jgi:hypothetical protein
LVLREPGRPGWAVTQVWEQVQELLRRLVQEPERVLREQGHLVLAVLREQAQDRLVQELRLLPVESLERKVIW